VLLLQYLQQNVTYRVLLTLLLKQNKKIELILIINKLKIRKYLHSIFETLSNKRFVACPSEKLSFAEFSISVICGIGSSSKKN